MSNTMTSSHRLPAEQLLPGNPVRDGWEAGQSVFGVRTLRATPHIRKWLQLRIAAGPAACQDHLKAALEVAWCEPLIIRRWQRVAFRMDVASSEAVAANLPSACQTRKHARPRWAHALSRRTPGSLFERVACNPVSPT